MATVPQKPTPATQPAADDKPRQKAHHRDSLREVAETVVFVVALVLMLKLFVVEAFVIPTGSMAETLYGYNKIVTCPDCRFEFPVNASNEVDPWDGVRRPVAGAVCPNCRHRFSMRDAGNPPNRSGDRVLVHKALYHFGEPDRGHVVVFKFPVDPQVQHTAQNYIKRLWGLGDETVAVHNGDLYVCRTLAYPPGDVDPKTGDPLYPRPRETDRLWEGPDVTRHSKTYPPYTSLGLDFTYHNADAALEAFARSRRAGFPAGTGGFELIRKPDDLCLEMRRIVYHNDHQSQILAKHRVPPRWIADGSGWKTDSETTPRVFTHSGADLSWVRYHHRVPGPPTESPDRGPPPDDAGPFGFRRKEVDDWDRLAGGRTDGLFEPTAIRNFLGYNAGIEAGIHGDVMRQTGDFWVGDLMLECEVTVAGPDDEVVLELSKGLHRFRASFTGGTVALERSGPGGEGRVSQPTPITRAGTYKLRFANFDCRLRAWVDGRAIDLGPAADYSPSDGDGYGQAVGAVASAVFAPRPDGHTLHNDVLAPASIGARGTIEVRHVVLWQDTYFTPAGNVSYHAPNNDPDDPVDTFYVQPGHYLCLGDNSGQSSDSRKWGLVPERLMLGRAVFVFAPVVHPNWVPRFDRVGFIR
jgi:signal peptidase I